MYNALIAQILTCASILAIWVKTGSDPDYDPGHRVSSCHLISMLIETVVTIRKQFPKLEADI